MRIVDVQDVLYNKVINDQTKGFVDHSKLEQYTQNYSEEIITAEMEYRPDKVAGIYLGDPKLAWLITYINNFENGIKDYKQGTKIKIPNL